MIAPWIAPIQHPIARAMRIATTAGSSTPVRILEAYSTGCTRAPVIQAISPAAAPIERSIPLVNIQKATPKAITPFTDSLISRVLKFANVKKFLFPMLIMTISTIRTSHIALFDNAFLIFVFLLT